MRGTRTSPQIQAIEANNELSSGESRLSFTWLQNFNGFNDYIVIIYYIISMII